MEQVEAHPKKKNFGCLGGCSITLLAFVLLCGLGLPLADSSSGGNSSTASAKWQAQNIQEYEITTGIAALGPDGETLRVDVPSDKVALVSTVTNKVTDVSSDSYYRTHTVASLLKQAQDCERIYSPLAYWGDMFAKGYVTPCSVEYNAELGYPEHIEGRMFSLSAGIGGHDGYYDLRVIQLKVLKRGPAATP